MKTIKGKIILVDDDKYEKALLEFALRQKFWNAQVEYFPDAETALSYLKKTKDEIFIIISDMNMPRVSGLDFKKIIDGDHDLSKKLMPFIFASTATTKEQVTRAYDYRVQGYFKKPMTVDGQAEMLDIIIRYWISSSHPNKDDAFINHPDYSF
ncbi:MAG: response regulator [Bacteroidia bacterium]